MDHLDCNLLKTSRQVGPTNLEQNCLSPAKQLGRVASPILVKESVMRREEPGTEYQTKQLRRVASPILEKENVISSVADPGSCAFSTLGSGIRDG